MVRRELSSHPHHSGSRATTSPSDGSENALHVAPSSYGERSLSNYRQDRSMSRYIHPAHRKAPLVSGDLGSSRSSSGLINTYASTTQPGFDLPATGHAVYPSNGLPSTPIDFARLFTPNRKLLIHHDDSTSDGNMNLRVDTEVRDSHGRSRKVILFHLRMHDLKGRRFSLRRYCRGSGQQICSSSRNHSPTPILTSASPNPKQLLGHASHQPRLHHAGTLSHHKSISGQDSARDSIRKLHQSPLKAEVSSSETDRSNPDTIQLSFSDRSHIEFRKRGLKRSKRYEYELWGTKYQWRRQIYHRGHLQEVSYHLINIETSKSIAHITPETLTAREAQEEEDFGGWVPPCTMQITDRRLFRSLNDVSE
jgi:hypothetical protein